MDLWVGHITAMKKFRASFALGEELNADCRQGAKSWLYSQGCWVGGAWIMVRVSYNQVSNYFCCWNILSWERKINNTEARSRREGAQTSEFFPSLSLSHFRSHPLEDEWRNAAKGSSHLPVIFRRQFCFMCPENGAGEESMVHLWIIVISICVCHTHTKAHPRS